MARSKDLDTIAPDDLIVSQETEQQIQKPIQEKKEEIPVEEIKQEIKKSITEEKTPQEIYKMLGHSKSPFSAFLINPKVFNFIERDDDEEIYLAIRPHPVINLSWVLIPIVMLFIPFLFKYLTFLNYFPIQYKFSIVLFWYLITFIYAFEKFLSWYFNLFIITNQRVVDISFNNLLNKHFAEANLSMIQDVSSSVRGLFGTFFNFGDVLVQTASEINQITFEKVPNPEKIIRLLKELRDLDEENSGGKKNE